MPREHFVEDGAHRIDVDARLPAAPTNLLGSNVVGGRDGGGRPGECEATIHERVRHPKVNQADGPVVAENDVSWLEVIVHDLMAVQVVDGFAQAAGEAECLCFRQMAPLANSRGERRARQVFGHHNVSMPVRCEGNVAQDIRVIQADADFRFTLRHRPSADAARILGQRNLDRHQSASVLEVTGLEDCGHPAAADFFEQQESAFQRLAWNGLEGGRHVPWVRRAERMRRRRHGWL